MRIDRLADLLEHKYGLVSMGVGAPAPHTLELVKKTIRNAYDLYVNPSKAKEPVIQMIADLNEPYAKSLNSSLARFIAELDTLTPTKILNRLIKFSNAIYQMTESHEATVRKSIHEAVRRLRTPDENYRELIKSKFGMALYRISGQFVDAARELSKSMEAKIIIPPKISLPPPKALSKDQRLKFLYDPKAKMAGIDSLDIMQKVMDTNKGPLLLDDLIRSKSPNPPSLHAIRKITDAIKSKMALKETNVQEFEQTPTDYNPENLFEQEEEPEHVIEGDPTRADPSVLDPTEITRKQEQVKKEDEERAKREQDWESKMISKYNDEALQKFLRKVS